MSYGNYGSYGSYGAWGTNWGVLASTFLPTDLGADLLQWCDALVSPSTVTDVSTNLVDGVLKQSVCATFDGVADAITISAPSPSGSFSMSARMNNPSTGGATQGLYGTDGTEIYSTIRNVSREFVTYIGAPEFATSVSALNFPIDTDVHVVLTWDGTSGEIYFDGVSQSAITTGTPKSPTSGGAVIGNKFSGIAPLLGSLSNFELWDEELTAQDALDLNDGVAISKTPHSSYPLTEASGSTVYDTVGSANGTITVGAGGLSTFWAGRQDVFHNFALNGGTVTATFELAADYANGTSTTTGTGKALTGTVRTSNAGNVTVFDSDAKIIELVWNASFSWHEPEYNSVGTGIFYSLGDTIPLDFSVDVGASIKIGGAGADGLEIVYIALEDNGKFTPITLDAPNDIWYNSDQSKNDLTFINGNMEVLQIPSSTSGFVGDFDGAVDKITTSLNSGTAGTIYKFSVYANVNASQVSESSLLGNKSATNNDGMWFFMLGGGMRAYFGDSGTAYDNWNTGIAPAYGVDTKYEVEFNSSTGYMDLKFDDVIQNSKTLATLIGHNPLNSTGAYSLGTTDVGSANKLFTGKIWDGVINVDGVDIHHWLDGSYFDDVTVFDTIGSANGTVTGTIRAQNGIVQIAAHEAGNGNALANPVAGVHNGGIYANAQDVGSVALLANLFWSADGITYDNKTYLDHLTHVPFNLNVAQKYDASCGVDDVVTFDALTGAQYDGFSTWLGASSCGGTPLEPLTDVGGDYITDVNGDLIFPAPA